MGGDSINAESVGVFPSSGGPEDRENDGSECVGQSVLVPPVYDAMEALVIYTSKESIHR